MLMLVCYAGNDRYAIESSRVIEVIPRVVLRKVYHLPAYVAGLFNYRGEIVAVIDMCQLIQGIPSNAHLSTRIIMLGNTKQDGTKQYLGLMAERVTETINQPAEDLVDKNTNKETAYIGGMFMDDRGMIQYIRLDPLFKLNPLPDTADSSHLLTGA